MQSLASFVPLILIIVIFYFFLIRPQSKQQKQIQEMRDNMKVGDEVVTIGGFYGIIYAIDDKNVVLEMLPDFNKTMVVKSAISKVLSAEDSLLVDEDDDLSVPEEEDALEDYDENLVISDPDEDVEIEEAVAEADEPEEDSEAAAAEDSKN